MCGDSKRFKIPFETAGTMMFCAVFPEIVTIENYPFAEDVIPTGLSVCADGRVTQTVPRHPCHRPVSCGSTRRESFREDGESSRDRQVKEPLPRVLPSRQSSSRCAARCTGRSPTRCGDRNLVASFATILGLPAAKNCLSLPQSSRKRSGSLFRAQNRRRNRRRQDRRRPQGCKCRYQLR